MWKEEDYYAAAVAFPITIALSVLLFATTGIQPWQLLFLAPSFFFIGYCTREGTRKIE